MKQMYEVPEMEVVLFEADDIIVTSEKEGLTNGGAGSGDDISFGDLFPDL